MICGEAVRDDGPGAVYNDQQKEPRENQEVSSHSVGSQGAEVGLLLSVSITLALVVDAVAIDIHIGSPVVSTNLGLKSA